MLTHLLLILTPASVSRQQRGQWVWIFLRSSSSCSCVPLVSNSASILTSSKWLPFPPFLNFSRSQELSIFLKLTLLTLNCPSLVSALMAATSQAANDPSTFSCAFLISQELLSVWEVNLTPFAVVTATAFMGFVLEKNCTICRDIIVNIYKQGKVEGTQNYEHSLVQKQVD